MGFLRKSRAGNIFNATVPIQYLIPFDESELNVIPPGTKPGGGGGARVPMHPRDSAGAPEDLLLAYVESQ